MLLDTLPNEILTHIFTTLPNINAVISLASTCTHFHGIYHGSQRLAILAPVLDAEFGPLDDIIQICTYNASQPAHHHRSVPLSDALVEQILKIGRVAKQWEDIYPSKKWKNDYAARRLLTPTERHVLRRALYRLWLFARAFHTRCHPRTSRNTPQIMAERAALLHNWSTAELAEMLDLHHVFRDVVANKICPSNGKIRQKFAKRYPDSDAHQLLFNLHGGGGELNYMPPAPSWCVTDCDGWFNNNLIGSAKYTNTNSRLHSSRSHEEGWGDDITHYYVVEDMMKLHPQQILFLKDRCPLKSQVEGYVRACVDDGGYGGGYGGYGGAEGWFVNNGETFSETLWFVVKQRGGEVDVEGFKAAVEEGGMGVAIADA